MYGGDGNDSLSAINADMYGDKGDDTLDGEYSNLYGGDGNDSLAGGYSQLYGGDGNDSLIAYSARVTGGKGNDSITLNYGLNDVIFNSYNEGLDSIKGFSVDADFGDSIWVSASGFGAGLAPGLLPPEKFVIGSSATDLNHRFIYNNQTGAMFFDADGNGAQAQVQFATLSQDLPLSGNEINVIA